MPSCGTVRRTSGIRLEELTATAVACHAPFSQRTPPAAPPACPRSVPLEGDARCGVDLEDPAFKSTGAVIDILRDRAFTASGLSVFSSGWFTLGTVEWISGANAGRRAEIIAHDVTDGIAVLTQMEAPVRVHCGR